MVVEIFLRISALGNPLGPLLYNLLDLVSSAVLLFVLFQKLLYLGQSNPCNCHRRLVRKEIAICVGLHVLLVVAIELL